MTDPNPLESELTEQLLSRANSAGPPPDAWERFVSARASAPTDVSTEIFEGDVFAAVVPVVIEPDRGSHDMNESRRKWLSSPRLGVAAVAAALLVVAIGIGVAARGDDTNGDTTGVDAQTGLDVMDDYFTAFNFGDIDAMMSLFSPEATFSRAVFGDLTADEFMAQAIWNVAQQTERIDPQCDVAEEAGGVVCTYDEATKLTRAVGGTAVPNTTRATVIDGEITAILDSFGFPDYNVVGNPFDAWMDENYPEVANRTGCCFGSLAEAQSRGELRAEYAELWAADLEANLCTYNLPCDVNPMGDYFAAFEVGDVDAMMALFKSDATFAVAGLEVETAEQFEAFLAWQVAQQGTWLDLECAAGGELRQMVCTHGDLQYVSRIVGGTAVPNTITVTIVGGEIVALESVSGGPSYSFVDVPFDSWVRKNYPEVIEQTACCSGATVEEARANGELRSRYADLWAAYLEENDCDYFDTDC